MIGSVRHAAICELRKARRKARHTTDSRPPWPGWGGRLRWWAAARKPGLGQIVVLVACVAVFTILSLAASAGRGLSEATTSSLAVAATHARFRTAIVHAGAVMKDKGPRDSRASRLRLLAGAWNLPEGVPR